MLDLTDRSTSFYWQADRELSAAQYEQFFLHRQKIINEELIAVLKNGITTITPITEIIIIEPDSSILKGNVNIVRKVLINGELYIVRMHPQGIKNGYFYVEAAAIAAAKSNGLPVPKVIEIHEVTDESDMDFMLMSAVTGVTMESAIQYDSQVERSLLRQAGQLLAYTHQITVEKFGSFDNTVAKETGKLVGLHDNYRDFIFCGLDENLQRLVDFEVIDAETANQFKEILEEADYTIPGGARLIHNDYADSNILVDENRVSAILDWDECHGGDPLADLACWSTFFEMERFAEFKKGYEAISDILEDADEQFHVYRLRYIISKVALQVRRAQVAHSQFIQDKIVVGKQTLQEELEWFR